MISRKSTVFFVLGSLALTATLIWSVVLAEKQRGPEVIFFDIGQGSAVFIEDSLGHQILIDGGPGDKILSKLAQEMPTFDRDIDLIILTHPDSDHLNGALEALKNYQVAGILESCIEDDLAAYQRWQEIIRERQIDRICARFGQRIKLADGAKIDIFFPFFSLKDRVFSNTNDASIVARLQYGGSCFLLTGDAPQKTEKALITANLELDCEILQVGHHGSKTSTSQEFLQAVKAEIAVISVGQDNRYGHPHSEVLDRLRDIEIYRTDEEGDIRFECNQTGCLLEND